MHDSWLLIKEIKNILKMIDFLPNLFWVCLLMILENTFNLFNT